MKFAALLTAATAARSLRSLEQKLLTRLQMGRFENLEECEKAYAELLGEEPASTSSTTSTTSTTSTSTTSTTSTTTRVGIAKAEVGDIRQDEAKMKYNPPMSGTGKPSEDEGWDYLSHGKDWGAFGECAGEAQSPVDITKFVDIKGQTKSVLWFDYYTDPHLDKTATHSFTNAGHGPFFASGDDLDLGYVKIGADESEAIQYTFHAPSEHTIDGQTYPLEVQILHKTPQDTLLGVSVLFKFGDSNTFLHDLKAAVPSMPQWFIDGNGAHSVTMKSNVTGAFNLDELLHKGDPTNLDMTFYNYEGSLTAPPCTPGVQWWVSSQPLEASKEEIDHVRAAITGTESTKDGNNRKVQPLNGRNVFVGHTGFQHHIKQHGHAKDNNKIRQAGYNSQDTPWQGF